MTARDDRSLLFRRLRAAAGRLPCPPAPPAGESAPPLSAEESRCDRFGSALAAAGGLLFTGPVESMLHELGETLRAAGVTVLFSPEDDAAARRVAEALAPFGPFALSSSLRAGDGDAPAVTAGFRTAEAGIAETGTVVETSAEGRTLLPGLLPDVQVSLLPVSSLFDRLEDALASLGPDFPRAVSFRSGPARTADIEQTFTAGVCGPRIAIVLLLE